MRLLLDTHVWLWLQHAPERLGEAAIRDVEEPGNDRLFSAASFVGDRHQVGTREAAAARAA